MNRIIFLLLLGLSSSMGRLYAQRPAVTASTCTCLDTSIWNIDSVKFRMVRVNGGSYDMGDYRRDLVSQPVHNVSLSDFYIGQTEVTQDLWSKVMGGNPAKHKGTDLPVEQVSWYDCILFCNYLSEDAGLTPYYRITDIKRKSGGEYYYIESATVSINDSATGFRLPTEAQWEYAARGGLKHNEYLYAGSNKLEEVAWYYENCNNSTHPVAQKKPNRLGLFDMCGNVMEWCFDWSGDYHPTQAINPLGPSSGRRKVLRGGSWRAYIPHLCRVSFRNSGNACAGYYYYGMRLVAPVQNGNGNTAYQTH
jgi:formylglycine-generating enzyme required for sulfatase activity